MTILETARLWVRQMDMDDVANLQRILPRAANLAPVGLQEIMK